MFTGIVEEVGMIEQVVSSGNSCVLTIRTKEGIVLEDARIGDSIAVNGVCLTVTERGEKTFSADVMHETLDRSTLKTLKNGSLVNLERAMPANGRFGGHIVSGHIDGTGTITRIKQDANAVWFTVSCEPRLLRYIVEKASVAIEGISLTVARVTASDFSVSVIPHTRAVTNLAFKRVGDEVNIENDIMGKYVERMMAFPREGAVPSGNVASASGEITEEYLIKCGF